MINGCVLMIHNGEERTNRIRCSFNPSIVINFQGVRIVPEKHLSKRRWMLQPIVLVCCFPFPVPLDASSGLCRALHQ